MGALPTRFHMMPESKVAMVIVAVFQREDLVRLHTLLACYASPFRTKQEAAERAADEQAHDTLRRYVADLLH